MNPPADSTTALIIFVILIVTFLILIVELENAYPIKMELMSWTMNEKPIVCLENTGEYKWATLKAIHLWNGWTNNEPIWHIDSTTSRYCNIQIILLDELDTGGVGNVLCKTEKCYIKLQRGERTDTDRVRTVTHELGHAFSLGHFPHAETAVEALWLGACNTSFMWFRGECGWPEFPDEMRQALICRHTYDGFGGNINIHCGYQVISDRGVIEHRLTYGTGYDWKKG